MEHVAGTTLVEALRRHGDDRAVDRRRDRRGDIAEPSPTRTSAASCTET